jgi:long-chain acyl-CoA synthetase
LKLKDDLNALKPTIFASVPRLYNKFYDTIKGGIAKAGGIKAFLANTGL